MTIHEDPTMYAFATSAAREYQSLNGTLAVDGASPHRLISMLFDGAIDRLALAKGCMQNGEAARKGELVGKTLDILGGLRGALNPEAGGTLAKNLDGLYSYMEVQLVMANLHNDTARLDEVSRLLHELRDAWSGIGAAVGG